MHGINSLRADAVFGWRQLNKHRVTSAAAILSLGVAIGACTSVFRLVDGLFLRPLPVSNPQRLYVVSRPTADQFGDGWEHVRFRRMRAAMKDEADLIAASFPERTDLTVATNPVIEKAQVQYVSGWMFRSFGLKPAVGRLFTEAEDLEPGANPVAILTYNYWTRRFGRDPRVAGSKVTITRKYGVGSDIFEIAGVVGEGFTGTEPGTETDIFVPSMMHPLVNLPVASLFRILVRLPPGVTPEPIRNHLQAVLHALNQQDGKSFPYRLNQRLTMRSAASGVSAMQENYAQALAVLGVLVTLVLLIACANITSLMSGRAAARGREMALRVSIGAGRARLVQLVLIESAMLALAASVVGAIVAWQAAPLVVARINPPDMPAQLSLAGDWRVFSIGVALTVAATIFSGLTPALRVSAIAPASALRGEGPRPRRHLAQILIAGQAAFCLLVLFVCGLFAVTFQRLSHQLTGSSVRGLLALEVITPRDEPPSAWEQVAEHLRSVPGVESVAESEWPLLDGNGYRLNHISVEGGRAAEDIVRFLIVSPGWINTMQIPLIEGRGLRAGEKGAAVVNREFARKYFPGENPVGKWFEAAPGGEWGHRFLITGVVGDTRYRSIRDPILPVAYIPYQLPWHAETFMVRMAPSKAPDPLAAASILRQEVARARPGFHLTRVRTEEGMLQAQAVRERFAGRPGCILRGCRTFARSRRAIRGFGLLGGATPPGSRHSRRDWRPSGEHRATRHDKDLRDGGRGGGLVGVALGMVSTQYIRTLLYQVGTADIGVLAVSFLTLLAAGMLAGFPAVVRAVRVDPVNVLRAD